MNDAAPDMTGFPSTAPSLRGRVVFDQQWRNVCFLHWPVRPNSVAHLFPRGSRPDVFGGSTYVGLVPFELGDAGFGSLGAVPYFGTFLETNIRLYSVDDAGRHGVVFRSLDTQRLAILPLARWVFGVPYAWASMRSTRVGDRISYDSRRRWPQRGLRTHVVVDVGEAVEPTALEVWLTARWGLHSRIAGRTYWTPNEHGPWPLHRAEVLELSDDLLGASAVAACAPLVPALWSPGVRTRFGRPTPL